MSAATPTHQLNIDYHSDPEWILVDDVPILDEHRLFLPADKDKGTPDRWVNVDQQLLSELATNNNRLVSETGDMIPLTEGHTVDDAPESQQPEILGWADNFGVKPLFQSGRMALTARFRISKNPEKLKKVQNLPRRSVELWLDRREVNPISLLGATAPERNLGLLRLNHVGRLFRMGHSHRAADGKSRYEMTRLPIKFQAYGAETMLPMPGQAPMPSPNPIEQPGNPNQTPGVANVDPAMVQAVVAAITQTDVWQQMQAMMTQMQGMMQPPQPGIGQPDPMAAMMGGQPGMGQPGAGGDMGGDMGGLLAALMGGAGGGGDGDADDKQRDGDKVNMQAGPGMSLPGAATLPSATGNYVPGMNGQQRDRSTATPRISMSRAQDHMKAGETAEAAIIRLAGERDAAIKFGRRSQVMAELAALVTNENIDLDINEELPLLETLTDDQRAIQYQRMRVRYKQRGRPGQQTAALPSLTNPGEVPPVESPVVGARVPDRRMQRSASAMNAPMTREEMLQCVDLVNKGLVPSRDVNDALPMVRSGYGSRNGVNGVESVY